MAWTVPERYGDSASRRPAPSMYRRDSRLRNRPLPRRNVVNSLREIPTPHTSPSPVFEREPYRIVAVVHPSSEHWPVQPYTVPLVIRLALQCFSTIYYLLHRTPEILDLQPFVILRQNTEDYVRIVCDIFFPSYQPERGHLYKPFINNPKVWIVHFEDGRIYPAQAATNEARAHVNLIVALTYNWSGPQGRPPFVIGPEEQFLSAARRYKTTQTRNQQLFKHHCWMLEILQDPVAHMFKYARKFDHPRLNV